MSVSLVIRPDAEADLAEACLWYEEQRTGLGAELLGCVETALKSIQQRPLSCPAIHESIRRSLVSRFPFGIYYVLEEDTVFVLSIMHAKRDPSRWKSRNPKDST